MLSLTRFVRTTLALLLVKLAFIPATLFAQPLGQPDQSSPGDAMIQQYLARETARLEAAWTDDVRSLADWQVKRERYREEYLYMLGLWPLPKRTPLQAQVTRQIDAAGYSVECLHYQSAPGLYVTANLYRPSLIPDGRKLPAVLYVCGHSSRGRNGNKTAFQSHGIWFARHGYVCLVVDTLQLGEIAAIHHGTYNLERWWWLSRGYTSAGVECWNGVRGVDYLASRPDVDPARIAVTGISGGGAATFWVAAADPRVAVAVPVSGMADLASYVPNRVINGHCDCMFLHNAFQWPWTRIAALIAPRPLLFVNSDQDGIFPMDANERIANRLERVYSLFGAGDRVDALVSIGGHDYRLDIRQGIYRFLNSHLKGDARVVADGEIDLVDDQSNPPAHPIAVERLRAFPTDADIPRDERNTTIDQSFVPRATVVAPTPTEWPAWRDKTLAELRRVTFGAVPERIPAARLSNERSATELRVETEPGIEIAVRYAQRPIPPDTKRIVLIVAGETADGCVTGEELDVGDAGPGTVRVLVEPRGIGATRWTRRNPPNYVERSLVLLGRTADTLRIRDVVAVARWLRETHPSVEVHVAGEGAQAVLAGYAAVLESDIAGARLVAPPDSHQNPAAPALLNVLRVGDIPDLLGLLAPRPLWIAPSNQDVFASTRKLFAAANAAERLTVRTRP